MSAGKVDLHVHTTASDGRLSPAEVVQAAKEAGLVGLAITDHDAIDGIAPAQAEGEKLGMIVVPGIEINTDFGQSELHILGYFIETDSPILCEHLTTLRSAREERGRQMVEKLRGLGFDITFERVKEIAAGGAIGRPHVARAMVEAGYSYDMNSAFGKYLVRGTPGYVPRYKLTPVQAIGIIREAGGAPVLAHPGSSKHDEMIPELVEAGLAGIEAYHTDHSKLQTMHYRKLAQKYNIIVTAGSDYHGPDMLKRVGIGHCKIGVEVVDELRAAAMANRA